MSENTHGGSDSKPAQELRTFDFPTFLDSLRRPLTPDQIATAGDILRRANELFEAFARDGQPLPDSAVRLVESLRREFARIRGLHTLLASAAGLSASPICRAHLQAPGAGDPVSTYEAPSVIGFDPIAEIPIILNYWHIEKTAGPGAAEAALTAFVKRLRKKKPMGRPRSKAVSEVCAAKRERDRGLTWGQIARKLGFRDAKDAALATTYHFRGQRSKKKSR